MMKLANDEISTGNIVGTIRSNLLNEGFMVCKLYLNKAVDKAKSRKDEHKEERSS